MNRLEDLLENIGYSPKKSKIYLAILELGEASILDISRKTGIKRTTVYNLIPELMADGVVQAGSRKSKRFFYIDDPRSLKTGLDMKIQRLERALPQFAALQSILPSKPKITYFEGLGGARELFADTLTSCNSGDTILDYAGLTDFDKLVPEEFSNDYIRQRVAKKIRIKVIAPDSPLAREWQKNDVKELREIKIVPGKDFPFIADAEIYANKVALISFKENFMGVIIESPEIHQLHRMSFELLWKFLK
ncbi:MAG: transcriptional regulator, TrmB [uncultured bacterium]|uniref:Transcriptional regulator, TrmB n=1 Tax=Candidatus Wolfebacteria bacterium GW2011_GWE2_44_13 TaxID=1619017 RepID=A0A0G1H731_9BACT|nr:MAG: transcriptional regulator, TrmB [uncultured bacterium]KKT43176.1 MAG: Transcriptional regulator, TrmB [Candidatus Wolfebacteria bacterium GW2011_GWE2_44_13]